MVTASHVSGDNTFVCCGLSATLTFFAIFVFHVVDGSWQFPHTGRDVKKEFTAAHIPGSVKFVLDECCDRGSPYDQMLPSGEQFASYVGGLGVGSDCHVVVYDNSEMGMFSAQRVWWLFRSFGHDNTSILNGGLPAWKAAGLPMQSGEVQTESKVFKAKFRPEMVASYADVQANLAERSFQLADARPPGRFNGKDAEPRKDIESGHVPDAVNIPFGMILNQETKTVKTPEQLKKIFEMKKIDLRQPLVIMCGSGMTATGIYLAAFACGKTDMKVYDGSWTEWALRSKPEHRIKEAVN
ncbi:PREDICTED: 3-mercaptopyruvate sulfurtransferase-like [Priapulus caudatus]|uniref:3-mercaptopyruvate sulfurtransferase-like n=1 Tax=Priapulus caudatus TaxID=37621 RepID=A0ABM1FBW2_PRICU|nr:PREDICTED: 3-mercaptopyruvate sulfurtransferase-like [Priapulus caudatus]